MRGTLSFVVDTNYRFCRSFRAKYKGVEFKYTLGEGGRADGVTARIQTRVEDTYLILTELISALSYAHDCAFRIGGSCHDSYSGSLDNKIPAISENKMMTNCVVSAPNGFADTYIIMKLPEISEDSQANLVRLYRLAKVEEFVNPLSCFLFYYHILDYPRDGETLGDASRYINKFCEALTDSHTEDLINKINSNRVFEKICEGNQDKKYDGTLGGYINQKVRSSVAHIIRFEESYAHNLKIDSFSQNEHFLLLKQLMKCFVRDKLDNQHGFNIYCDQSTFTLLD